MKRRYFALVLALGLIVSTSVSAQNRANFWLKTTENAVSDLDKVDRNFKPSEFKLYSLDFNALKNALVGAPVRGVASSTNLIMTFPTPEGTLENFKVSHCIYEV
jgi:hypothetical protein